MWPASTRARPSTAEACECPKSSWMPVEELARLAQALDGAQRAAGPEPHRTGQHQHHAERPAVAAAPVAGEDGLGHLAGLGGVALLEARPGQQAVGPAQAALVADLLEGGGGLAQQPLGLLGPPGVERAPGQVLPRPGHAAAIVERLEAGQGLLEQLGGGGVLVAEQGARSRAGGAPRPRRTRRRGRRRPDPPPRGRPRTPPTPTPSARCRPARAAPARGRRDRRRRPGGSPRRRRGHRRGRGRCRAARPAPGRGR